MLARGAMTLSKASSSPAHTPHHHHAASSSSASASTCPSELLPSRLARKMKEESMEYLAQSVTISQSGKRVGRAYWMAAWDCSRCRQGTLYNDCTTEEDLSSARA